MKRTGYALALFVLLCAMGIAPRGSVFAQDPKPTEPAKDVKPAEPAKDAKPAATPAAAPAATAPAATAPANPPAISPADAKAAADEFKAKLNEWKGILKDLRTVRQKFDSAEEGQDAGIRAEWDSLVHRGEALIPSLRRAGVKAYAAAPNDREIERFLVTLLKDDIESDRYEEAAELGKGLLEAGCEVKEVVDAAGVAAFRINDYDTAEKYLTRAKKEGSISTHGVNDLSLIPQYREFWAKEQEIRKQEAEKDDLPRIKMSTSKGDIVIELFENEAPGAVGNFVNLVEKGFYNGLSFHRVLPAFMAQGGCPEGTGTGGPGYAIYCECYEPNYRKHFRGTLSMAHAGRDTGGSQFFLTFAPTAHLNGRHTAFGRVIEGFEVLAKITRIDPESKDEKPVPDSIVKIEVLRKRDHEYKPNKVQ
jgi:cyclophilin family peptidyl-prolyl cis-trans isomerase